jgi:hypothetical protein
MAVNLTRVDCRVIRLGADGRVGYAYFRLGLVPLILSSFLLIVISDNGTLYDV